MNNRTDILLDENENLIIRNGDFVIGNSDIQHTRHIVKINKGEHKQSPTIGFGINNYLQSTISDQRFKRDLKVALAQDGYDAAIDLSGGIERLEISI